jgi:hypothetical protein
MRSIVLTLITAVFLTGCLAAGDTTEDKRRNIQNMRKEVLADLYRVHPEAQEEIRSAPGYAVFSNWNAYLIFASVGQGYGVVVDNVSGANTYMGMGAGLSNAAMAGGAARASGYTGMASAVNQGLSTGANLYMQYPLYQALGQYYSRPNYGQVSRANVGGPGGL